MRIPLNYPNSWWVVAMVMNDLKMTAVDFHKPGFKIEERVLYNSRN